MKYTFKEKTPEEKQVIVFKTKLSKFPEVGVFETFAGGVQEVYVPSCDDVEQITNIEWWCSIPA